MGKAIKWLAGIFVVFVVIGLLMPTQDEVMTQIQEDGAALMRDIENQVAADAVAQYRIVERNGSAMDKCVQAGMVAAAFLQANDEGSYSTWKATERTECAAAGISR